MLWLLVFFFGGCLAEWPPSSCHPRVDVKQTTVTLTSPQLSDEEYDCTLQEQFEDTIFIDMERKYSNKRFEKAHDSILGLTMSHPGGEFSILVHNDRITTHQSPQQCRGLFASRRTRLKIEFTPLPEMRKTFVSVRRMANGRFVQCLSFDLDELFYSVRLKIHAITETGMIQSIHGISKYDTNKQKMESQHEQFEQELQQVKEQVQIVQSTLRDTIEKLERNHVLVHDKHNEMKRVLENSMRHSDSRIAQKVRHHSHGFFFVVVLSSVLMCAFIKYNSFAKKRIEHIL